MKLKKNNKKPLKTIRSQYTNLENEVTVEMLIEAGAKVMAVSDSGLTALHRACYLREFHFFSIEIIS